MLETLRLADLMLRAGLVSRAPALEPGTRYRITRGRHRGRRVRYVSPHRRPNRWEWTGKVNVIFDDTRRRGVVRPQALEPCDATESMEPDADA